MEHFEVIQLFAGALEFDGLAGDGQHRKGCTAAGVAVGLGQDDAIHADGLVEGLGDIHRVLTGHGIHDQQRLVHRDGFLDLDQLLHQDFVDLQAAGGIKDDDVIAVVLRVGQRLFGDDRRLFAVQRKDRCPRLFAHDLQLVNGGGAVDIARHQHGAAALLDEILGKLGRVGGFTVALQAAEHDDGLALVLDDQLLGFLAAHQRNELFVDDLDDLLGRGQALHDLLPHGSFGDLGAEVLGHLVVDVGFQQGHPHFAHGGLDVRFGQFAVAAQFLEHTGKAVGQRFKSHVRCSSQKNVVSALVDLVHGPDDSQHLSQRGCVLGGGELGVGAGALESCIDDELFQLFQLFLHPAIPGRKAHLGFQLLQGGLTMLDGVPCALPGNAEVLADLTQGEVIVVILVQHLALLGREDLAVKIEQIAHLKILCHCAFLP